MNNLDILIEQVRKVLIETNDTLNRQDLYSRFVNECSQLQLSEDDFYKTVLKPAHKTIDWAIVEEEFQKQLKIKQEIDHNQSEKAEEINDAPVFINRLINLSFETGTIKADAIRKIFEKAASLNQSSNAWATRINEKLELEHYKAYPQANLDALTLKEILLSTDWYSPDHYPNTNNKATKTRFNPLYVIIPVILLGSAIIYAVTGNKTHTENPPVNPIPKAETKTEEPILTPPSIDTARPYVNDPNTTVVSDSPIEKQAVSPSATETNAGITDDEVNEISQNLNTFYKADNNEELSTILSYFAFPVDRYYDNYSVDETTLQDMFVKNFSTKLLRHSITVDWSNTTIKKLPIGYLATITAEYIKVSQKEPDIEKSMALKIIMKLNENKKITSIYANTK